MRDNLKHLRDPHFRRSLFAAILLLIASLFVNFYAGLYSQERASNYVTDIILSNTRAYNLDGLFIYGSWIFAGLITFVCIRHSRKTPFILKSIALFVCIRAIFVSLTHIAPFPTQVALDPQSFLNYFIFGGGLFFSGHTGLPFLMSLIYWKDKLWRRIFLVVTGVFATVVLLAHLHYTIDVLSAFFITYGIFHMAEIFFAKDLVYYLAAD